MRLPKSSKLLVSILLFIWGLWLRVFFDFSSNYVSNCSSSSILSFSHHSSCDSLGRLLSTQSNSTMFAGDVNRLRRNWALTNPSCLERHFSFFEEQFFRRIHSRHLSLHIPKTAGTSLCRLAKKHSNFSTHGGNCWLKYFCPLWCKCSDREPVATCSQLDSLPDFVMNENWLDHPLCMEDRLYSISLRHPVDRALSHVNHYLEMIKNGGIESFATTSGWRLNLIQSNYLTWSLVSGLHEKPREVVPAPHHLEIAKEALSKFDFLLEFSKNKTCDSAILGFIGFNRTEPLHARTKRVNYSERYRRNVYEQMNDLVRLMFFEACNWFPLS